MGVVKWTLAVDCLIEIHNILWPLCRPSESGYSDTYQVNHPLDLILFILRLTPGAGIINIGSPTLIPILTNIM